MLSFKKTKVRPSQLHLSRNLFEVHDGDESWKEVGEKADEPSDGGAAGNGAWQARQRTYD
ncbi:hypothetical protein RPMA_25725 [Tardiphaga alba]|uniref:Uncharacterized protein n=1 Tax=Tardiphaga alba TaxID=340268 RepID=A0ABX8AHJ1_9BRAD|nr:hypothetical protein [Tardiphaga alba]QUS41860.1 hypothetical protein RPMA_25725 [Tardiphaga alba]